MAGRGGGVRRAAAFAALCAASLALAACAGSSSHPSGPASVDSSTADGVSAGPVDSASAKPTKFLPVHVSVKISDGATVGVGMPYVATFDKKITDGRAFARATTVT